LPATTARIQQFGQALGRLVESELVLQSCTPAWAVDSFNIPRAEVA
jgi:hypothetical protein